MKRTDADAASQRSYSCAETRNAISHLQAAESLHEISVKTPTLRDYFAAKALPDLIAGYSRNQGSGPYLDASPDEIAYWAYRYADAMLKARG